LNADFFTQLQKITTEKHGSVVKRVIRDVVDLFGSNFSLTLEDYFTQLEFFLGAVDIASRHPEFERSDFVRKRENLMAALSAVLEASTGDVMLKGGCAAHRLLVQHLGQGDAVISFNYDCLMDDALRVAGDSKWHPRWGYCFPLRGYTLNGTEHWTPSSPGDKDTSIRLLKLHGSVNWQLPEGEGREITLKQRLHQQRGVPRFTIIPPVWNKNIASHQIFRRIWREAAARLRAAKVIAIVGFSFVPTDLYAQSLFRIALGDRSHLEALVVANPDHNARFRIRQVFDVPLQQRRALLRQYKDFSSLCEALPEALG